MHPSFLLSLSFSAPSRILSHGRQFINILFPAVIISKYSRQLYVSRVTALSEFICPCPLNIGDGTKRKSLDVNIEFNQNYPLLSSFKSVYMNSRVQ